MFLRELVDNSVCHQEVKKLTEKETQKRIKRITTRETTLEAPVLRSGREYEEACERFSDERGFGELAPETLANCFRMRPFGTEVQFPGHKLVYFPATNEVTLDERAKKKLGIFAENNGVVCFVYRDGHTYVTKGLGIVEELIAAGYSEGVMHVPFSSGEKIIPSGPSAEWNAIKPRRAKTA